MSGWHINHCKLPLYLLNIYINSLMCCRLSRVNLLLLCTSFPSCSIRASSHSLPCVVIALRNPHVLISGPHPSSCMVKFTACQGHYHPWRSSVEEKGGKAPFSVDAITFLTLSSYSFDWNRAITQAAPGPWFWETLLLLLQQHFGEPVVVSGCNPHPGVWLPPRVLPALCRPGSPQRIQTNNGSRLCCT